MSVSRGEGMQRRSMFGLLEPLVERTTRDIATNEAAIVAATAYGISLKTELKVEIPVAIIVTDSGHLCNC
jgi:hypothetical protein